MLRKSKSGQYIVKTKADAIEALERVEEIDKKLKPLMIEQTELKKAATAYADEKNLDVVQLAGRYWRLITRYTRMWVGTADEMPGDVSDAVSLYEICKGKKVDGKPLWQLVTKRVPDPEKINEAVGKGWVKEKEIHKAFIEKPQTPFLQRYEGEAANEKG